MSTRKIKIYTTLGSPGTIETNANTLGDLRPELGARGIDISGMKLLVGETRNELSEDVAILPEGDFKLYLVPSKTKSGSDVEASLSVVRNLLNSAITILETIECGGASCIKGNTLTTDELEAAEEIKALLSLRDTNENEDWD